MDRRSFIAFASMVAAAAGNTTHAKQPASPAESADDPVDDLRAAARVAGLEFTDDELRMMRRALSEHRDDYQRRRRTPFENGLAGALIFDPARFAPAAPAPADHFAPRPIADIPLPADDEDIAFAPVTHLSHWLHTRRLTSARLTSICLARIERLDPTLQAVITVTRERARAEAEAADRELDAGRSRGPLHGIPYGAKDLFDTANIRTTWGAAPYRDRVPERDATVITRLRDAGAVLIAKTSLGALAYGDIWFDGRTRNPFNTAQGSSGSSAGSAAGVVAGYFPFALGTETYGSIVSPCMRCGATGLRPTFGRVPRTGAMALCWSLDKIGPIARTVEDTMLVLHALNGATDHDDPSAVSQPIDYDASRPVEGLTVGYRPEWFEAPQGLPFDRRALDILRAAGVQLREITLPDWSWGDLLVGLDTEAASQFEELTLSSRDDELTWQEPEAWPNTFRAAWLRPAIELLQSQRFRTRAARALGEVMANVDAIISPSFAASLLLITNFTGHPCLTLRSGFRSNDRPHGITLWGHLFDEGTLARLGTLLETEYGVWERRPTL
ncbi:MAG: amidase [Phycisphaerales bacterium]|nr:amidase [Phycisphaerales bacterium]